MSDNIEPSKITINGVDYAVDQMNDSAKAQLQSVLFAQSEEKRLKAQLAVAQTALSAYQQALVSELKGA